MKNILGSIVFLSLALILGVREAKADWYWDAIQITCNKDLNYFSLRTVSFADLEPKDPEAARRLEKENGIYGIFSVGRIGSDAGISKHPYTCDLPSFTPVLGMMSGNEKFPARKITVEIDNNGATCKSAIIRIDGTEVDRFPANISECGQLGSHLVELDTFSELTDCTFSSGDIGIPNACNKKILSQWTGSE